MPPTLSFPTHTYTYIPRFMVLCICLIGANIHVPAYHVWASCTHSFLQQTHFPTMPEQAALLAWGSILFPWHLEAAVHPPSRRETHLSLIQHRGAGHKLSFTPLFILSLWNIPAASHLVFCRRAGSSLYSQMETSPPKHSLRIPEFCADLTFCSIAGIYLAGDVHFALLKVPFPHQWFFDVSVAALWVVQENSQAIPSSKSKIY